MKNKIYKILTAFYSQMHFDAYRVMIPLEIQYFSLNRILLLTIGLWPYKQSKVVLFQQILIFGILTSFIIFQVCESYY